MMKMQIIKIVAYSVLISTIATLSAICSQQKKHVKALKFNNEKQAAIIDSLLNRRMTVIDVKLDVTDKSTNKIYGRHNQGSIEMPSVKTYKIEFDSTNFSIK